MVTDRRSPCDKIIKLSVGSDDPIIINVHQGVLCKSSEFFKIAMKPEWADQRDEPDTIDLCEGTVDVVKLYVDWLYCSHIGVIGPYWDENLSKAEKSKAAHEFYKTLAIAYLFGDEVVDVKFQISVLTRFTEFEYRSIHKPGPLIFDIIYQGTSAGSPMRHFLCDYVVLRANNDPGWAEGFKQYPPEALVDIVTGLVAKRKMPSAIVSEMSPCKYFERNEA